MTSEKIFLGEKNDIPFMEFFKNDSKQKLPAVIIFPGGGYAHRAKHEAEPIAQEFLREGFHAFVVQYRVAPHKYPAPFIDAVNAIQYIRQNAEQLLTIPDKIAVCGFSAGGHLAAATAFFEGSEYPELSASIMAKSRPNAVILSYAVISFLQYVNEGTMKNLLGEENPSDKLREKFSWEKQVTPSSPPVFLWHTADDAVVHVKNALLMASALSENSVPFEMHIFPHGKHGLGLAKDDLRISQWLPLAASWLRQTFSK
ncbi:MAG TPA: alpha/beta hydrolase [Victivallales bacterium]|nr:alpha/beta hydrolase [Victivallales bacterium]HPO90283.1 alpha/beta hydrolase [Victivallales bacterium]HRR06302.1 alpha/beta hydrolase [Victivallales bacterium]HRU00591.1 alpha/beta hydrolase [Victivallales bacterium]